MSTAPKSTACGATCRSRAILIHHNKVWESMLNCNDYGGIETWQGGPFYVFNNLSYNALGYRNWERYSGTDAGFGHAYYLDGAFKNYHFNNIAWGKAKDVASPVVNCAAFQEIHQLPEHLLPQHRLSTTTPARGVRRRRRDATSTSPTSGTASASTSSATPIRPGPPPRAMPRTPARRRTTSRSNPMPMAETSFTTSRRWACWNLPGAGCCRSTTSKPRSKRTRAMLSELGTVSQDPAAARSGQGRLPTGGRRGDAGPGRQGLRAVGAVRRGGRVEFLSVRAMIPRTSWMSTGT